MLQARGYTDESIARHGFVSLPEIDIRYAIGARLLYNYEIAEVVGTLGMIQDGRRSDDAIAWLPQVDGSALIEWRRNEQGMITGFLYSPDIPILNNKGKAKKHIIPPRMSPSGQPHIAQPVHKTSTDIWYTEGIHKANLVSDQYGCIALGAMGIGNYKAMAPVATILDADKHARHIIAIDRDAWGGQQEKALAHALHDMGYQVCTARWDGEAKGPDDAIQASATITISTWQDDRAKVKTLVQYETSYDWQRKPARNQGEYLNAIGEALAEEARQHMDSGNTDTVLILASPPGTGKSHTVAELGASPERSIAYVVPRHDLRDSVPVLIDRYRHIMPPNKANCSEYELHNACVAKGYATQDIHHQHKCDYSRQFAERGSAVFQINHVVTPFLDLNREDRDGKPQPGMDAVVIDEMALQAWINDHIITIYDLKSWTKTIGDTAQILLTALQVVATEAEGSQTQLTGMELYNALDRHCANNLLAMLAIIRNDKRYDDLSKTYPWFPVDLQAMTNEEKLAKIDDKLKVTVPHLMVAMLQEVIQWQRGTHFNSVIRLGSYQQGEGEYAYHITYKRMPSEEIGPLTILDATADDTIARLYFSKSVEIVRPEVIPPPSMKHIAIRTGKRYGKIAMTQEDGHELNRAKKHALYLLKDLDPTGELRRAGNVGIITFMDCQERLGEALGIPEAQRGHFFAVRGDNRWQYCDILLIIGTPALSPDKVFSYARILYRDDPNVLDLTTYQDDDKHYLYTDPRCQHIADYLTRSELSQCAHRNRPLRFDNRTVVTFCSSDIDYLPATTTITQLPYVDLTGNSKEERLTAAVQVLQTEGKILSINNLVAAAHVDRKEIISYLRTNTSICQGGVKPYIELYIAIHTPLADTKDKDIIPVPSLAINDWRVDRYILRGNSPQPIANM